MDHAHKSAVSHFFISFGSTKPDSFVSRMSFSDLGLRLRPSVPGRLEKRDAIKERRRRQAKDLVRMASWLCRQTSR
jgi:hypothetical protein